MSKIDLYASKLREVCGFPFKITAVSKPYRKGWDEKEQKMRTFYFTESNEIKESVKNKETNQYELIGVTQRIDGAWFKLFKKTFDLDIEFFGIEKIATWKYPEGTNVKTARVPVSASHIKTIIETYTNEADNIQLIDGKDKAGNPAKVKPFDWEDKVIEKIIGVCALVKVTGEGMDTKYIFKPAPAPVSINMNTGVVSSPATTPLPFVDHPF